MVLIPGLVISRVLLSKLHEAPTTSKAAKAAALAAGRQNGGQHQQRRMFGSESARENARRRNQHRKYLSTEAKYAEKLRMMDAAGQNKLPNSPLRRKLAGKEEYEHEAMERDNVVVKGGGKEDLEDYTVIYRFKYVQHAAVLSRLKFYTTLMAVGIPGYCIWQSVNLTNEIMGLAGMFGLAILSTLSSVYVAYMSTRLVGIISLHKTKPEIRVGYLTFWGKRRNAVIPVENVVPFSDYLRPSDFAKGQIKVDLLRYNSQSRLFIPTFGHIIPEPELFEEVFGTCYMSEIADGGRIVHDNDGMVDADERAAAAAAAAAAGDSGVDSDSNLSSSTNESTTSTSQFNVNNATAAAPAGRETKKDR